jgi:hypothetical protein
MPVMLHGLEHPCRSWLWRLTVRPPRSGIFGCKERRHEQADKRQQDGDDDYCFDEREGAFHFTSGGRLCVL